MRNNKPFVTIICTSIRLNRKTERRYKRDASCCCGLLCGVEISRYLALPSASTRNINQITCHVLYAFTVQGNKLLQYATRFYGHSLKKRGTDLDSRNLASGLKLVFEWKSLLCCLFLLSDSALADWSPAICPLLNSWAAKSCKSFSEESSDLYMHSSIMLVSEE